MIGTFFKGQPVHRDGINLSGTNTKKKNMECIFHTGIIPVGGILPTHSMLSDTMNFNVNNRCTLLGVCTPKRSNRNSTRLMEKVALKKYGIVGLLGLV